MLGNAGADALAKVCVEGVEELANTFGGYVLRLPFTAFVIPDSLLVGGFGKALGRLEAVKRFSLVLERVGDWRFAVLGALVERVGWSWRVGGGELSFVGA